MENDKELLIKLLKKEIERSNEYLYKKYGKEQIEEFHRRMDEALEIRLKEEFNNLAEIKQ